jgi:hypothetical protein
MDKHKTGNDLLQLPVSDVSTGLLNLQHFLTKNPDCYIS